MRAFTLFVLISYAAGQESCSSHRTRKGICRASRECSELFHDVGYLATADLYKNLGDCKNSEGEVRWCCPDRGSENCTTYQHGTPGVCKGLNMCPVIEVQTLLLTGPQITSTFGFGCRNERIRNPMICCPLADPPSTTYSPDDYKVVCYFTNWSWYRKDEANYKPSNIDPSLCTHILYAFATLDEKSLTIKAFDPWVDYDKMLYKKVTNLRSNGVKVLVALGGGNDSKNDKYSRLVEVSHRRRRFTEHVIQFINDNNFDGLDIDWQHPVCWQGDCSRGPDSDKANFVAFIRELKEAFEPHGLLLSATAPHNTEVIDRGYDVSALTYYLDWISVLAYNYHTPKDNQTGHGTPLYSHSEDDDITLNVNYTIHYLIEKGADPKKLVLGMTTFGVSFTLAQNSSNTLNQETTGGGIAGPYSRGIGQLSYYEICDNILNEGWTVVKDPEGSMGPYAYKGDQWVSFDDSDFTRNKTEWVKEMGLGGVMIWSLDQDDFRNICRCERYPLLKTINRSLRNYTEPDPEC